MLFVELIVLGQIVALVLFGYFTVRWIVRRRQRSLEARDQRAFSARHEGRAASKKIERNRS